MTTFPPKPANFDVYCMNEKSQTKQGEEGNTNIYMTVGYQDDHDCYLREDLAATNGSYSKVSCSSRDGCVAEEGSQLRKESDSMDMYSNIFSTLCCIVCLGLIGFLIYNMTKTKPTTNDFYSYQY
jgi:hypothetical protein